MDYMFRVGDRIDIQRGAFTSIKEVKVTDIVVGSDNDSTLRCIVTVQDEDGHSTSVGFFALCRWCEMAKADYVI